MGVQFSWENYKPEGYKGSATWRIGDYTQSAEFPTFTHAHAIQRLVDEAYKTGKREAWEQARKCAAFALREELTP
jgi:hypothetical protein